ncbi:MAG: PDZ domain-containing protein [Terriglobales bacterium]
MICRLLLCMFAFSLVAAAQPMNVDHAGESWDWSYSSDDAESSYLGVDIADVTPDRLSALKLKQEQGAEITMVDQDAPAGKAGLHAHDVILSLNGTEVESAAQLRRMIKETPPGRVVALGISRDGQPMTIKVQLADRRKSMSWAPNGGDIKIDMPQMPNIPDIDFPISVVVVHQSARSGLMVENISSQLGDYFGVKGANGVLVRSVEKGSRGEKAGFRAGDVVIKVNNQPVHDASDFTHALRSSPGNTAAVTVMRDKKEQTLTLSLPEKRDSGSFLENSFDLHNFTAQTQQAINLADEVARLTPAMAHMAQDQARHLEEMQRRLQQQNERMLQRQQEMQERQQHMLQQQQQRLRHELAGDWAEI